MDSIVNQGLIRTGRNRLGIVDREKFTFLVTAERSTDARQPGERVVLRGQSRFSGAMAFEKAFVAAGGLLASGVDPTGLGGALAGYGDQRNYELFIEAGFTPEQAIRIMSLNGAKILGVQQRLGSIERGKLADLVVLKGDLAREPAVIRNPTLVFKDGIGYDSAKLIESIQGRVGID
jgi:alpha-D-ribose 1-methylphosphonate 5-triphosphate diphosphatase PhnM